MSTSTSTSTYSRVRVRDFYTRTRTRTRTRQNMDTRTRTRTRVLQTVLVLVRRVFLRVFILIKIYNYGQKTFNFLKCFIYNLIQIIVHIIFVLRFAPYQLRA